MDVPPLRWNISSRRIITFIDSKSKLIQSQADLVKYKAKLTEKMKYFHGVKHESSLSELRYSEVMVLRDIVRSLEKEIEKLKNGV